MAGKGMAINCTAEIVRDNTDLVSSENLKLSITIFSVKNGQGMGEIWLCKFWHTTCHVWGGPAVGTICCS